MEKMSRARNKVLNAVLKCFKEYGHPPSLRELCKTTGLNSTWTIRYHLKRLEDSGVIKINRGLSRGITLLRNTGGIPLLGKISAGKPIDAIENTDGNIELKDMFSNIENIFALKVKGDSMTGAGIFNGDIVFVKKQAAAANGDIVAAVINEEATVKRFYKSGSIIKLMPENPKYEPITSRDVKIAGKVVGILRKY